jgi:hypothetical protein
LLCDRDGDHTARSASPLADGRVEFDAPLALGRKLLRLLALDDIAVKAPRGRRAKRPAPAG